MPAKVKLATTSRIQATREFQKHPFISSAFRLPKMHRATRDKHVIKETPLIDQTYWESYSIIQQISPNSHWWFLADFSYDLRNHSMLDYSGPCCFLHPSSCQVCCPNSRTWEDIPTSHWAQSQPLSAKQTERGHSHPPSTSYNGNQHYSSTFLKCHYISCEPTYDTKQKIELSPTPFLQTLHGCSPESSAWPMLTAQPTSHDFCLSSIHSQTLLFHPLLPSFQFLTFSNNNSFVS